jgi:tRNA(Ile)-lysidine synthase
LITQKKFEENLKNLTENFAQKSFLLAVSGGVDSMSLLYLFRISGIPFQAAHINYKLRGKDSDADQKLVEDFCEKNDIKIHIYEVSKKDKKPENSIQLWARNLRYQYFFKVLKTEKLDFIVTAHHLNDELETFLINLSRGSGIKGLSGIPDNENKILRPFLHFTKNEIYRFAEKNNIEFREDLSNRKNDYIRNKIRNEIVPKLLETNENFLPNFNKSLHYLSQTKNFVEEKINEISSSISSKKDGNLVINKTELSAESDFVKFEILRKFGFDDETEIAKIFKAETGKSFYSNDFQLVVNRNDLILIPQTEKENQKSENEIELKINSENEILLPENLKFTKSFQWHFDSDQLKFPLKLRKKRVGDVFFPVGMTGKKKVSKFFKDEKFSILEKQKIWLLTDVNDDVLGIIPFRQDRRFAGNADTKKVLKITT